MKEIWKEMWTLGCQQEISTDADDDADDNDDESIVSPLRAGDTIIKYIEALWVLLNKCCFTLMEDSMVKYEILKRY